MKKNLKRTAAVTAFVLICSICTPAFVYAASKTAVMGTYTGESNLSVYVRGEDLNTDDVQVQIATAKAEQVNVQPVEESKTAMQTLVLVDNSLSITAKNQKKIAKLLNYIITDKLSNEEICIATFSEESEKLIDYTSDYDALIQAADSITYQRQSTYLTDALYDLIVSDCIDHPKDVCRRIIIISDGVDNKSIGYTKEELYSLIDGFQVPVYAVGCKNGKNNEELENMFALSRMTNADYFLLDQIKGADLLEIVDVLKQDSSAVKLTITPEKDQMDGSRKAVKIVFQGQDALTVEMAMPQPSVQEEVKEQTKTDETEQVKTDVQEPDKEKSGVPAVVFVLIGVGALLAGGIIFFICQRKKTEQRDMRGDQTGSRHTESDSNRDEDHERTVNMNIERTESMDIERTEQLHTTMINNDNEKTVMLWDQAPVLSQVILTDVDSPAKSFQVPIDQYIIVGRKAGQCTIVLDYDSSVSGSHCKISMEGDSYYVEDLNSSNGTYLNGRKLASKTQIVSGDLLKLGRLNLRFEVKQ